MMPKKVVSFLSLGNKESIYKKRITKVAHKSQVKVKKQARIGLKPYSSCNLPVFLDTELLEIF
jgi:hypothetical protein